MENIFKQIKAERTYQNEKWGNAFDDKNTINDWATYINIYLSKGTSMGASQALQREAIEKVAALAVAALETFDRNEGFPPRHYD